MGLLKSVRRLLIRVVMDQLGLSPDNHSVADIIDDDCRPEDVMPQVEDWLDINYPGSGNKRWTDRGYQYWEEADHFRCVLQDKYNEIESRDV